MARSTTPATAPTSHHNCGKPGSISSQIAFSIKSYMFYVDKTHDIYELVRYPKRTYFLSRPRRFGKSLLISTLAEIFQGNKELFQNLWIYQTAYQWETYPIIRLDFSQERVYTAAELQEVITEYRRYGLPLPICSLEG